MPRGQLPARKRPAATCRKRPCASKPAVQKKPVAEKEQTVGEAEKVKTATPETCTAEKEDAPPRLLRTPSPKKPSREAELLSPQGMLHEWDSLSDRAKLELLAGCVLNGTVTPEWVREGP